MKLEEFGIVVEANGNLAKVKAARHGDCENCGACPGENAIMMDVQNTISAKPGQRVAFVVHNTSMVIAAFVVYVLPIVVAAAGTAIGWFIANKFGLPLAPFQVGGGIIGFCLSLIIVKLYDKAIKKDTKSLPLITKIFS